MDLVKIPAGMFWGMAWGLLTGWASFWMGVRRILREVYHDMIKSTPGYVRYTEFFPKPIHGPDEVVAGYQIMLVLWLYFYLAVFFKLLEVIF
jgi:hypothetical protein